MFSRLELFLFYFKRKGAYQLIILVDLHSPQLVPQWAVVWQLHVKSVIPGIHIPPCKQASKGHGLIAENSNQIYDINMYL